MTKKTAIFLDTSVLPRNLLLQGQAIQELGELVQAGIVEVHLSEVARREWSAQMEAELERRANALQKALSDLSRFAPQNTVGKSVIEASAPIKRLKKGARKRAARRIGNFLESINANIIPIDGEAASHIFEDYFEGRPPFKQPKSRSDFPDAFILAALRMLAERGEVVAGVADGELNAAASGVDGVTVFDDLKMLTGKFRPKLAEVQQFQSLLSLLRDNEAKLTNRVGRLLQKVFDSCEIQDATIPSDNGDAMVVGYGEFEEIEYHWDSAYDYGGGWISVPFSFQAELMLHFFVHRSEAFSVPDWVNVEIGDFERDHSFEAQGERIFDCTANLSLKFTEYEIKRLRLPKNLEIDELETNATDRDSERGAH